MMIFIDCGIFTNMPITNSLEQENIKVNATTKVLLEKLRKIRNKVKYMSLYISALQNRKINWYVIVAFNVYFEGFLWFYSAKYFIQSIKKVSNNFF